jgi:hypothetical protein
VAGNTGRENVFVEQAFLADETPFPRSIESYYDLYVHSEETKEAAMD